MKKIEFASFKKYIIGFVIGISFISFVTYGSSGGTIGDLFEKINGSWKLNGINIKNYTIGNTKLGLDSVITNKIKDKSVTESKLADNVTTKINGAVQTEIDPTAVKLSGNQTVGGIKYFTKPIIGVEPISNSHLATKKYVDDAISNALAYTYSWDNTGTYGTCSVNCGGGIQIRPVTCIRSDGVVVADSYCTGTKPTTSQTCNTLSCEYKVVKGVSNLLSTIKNQTNHGIISCNPGDTILSVKAAFSEATNDYTTLILPPSTNYVTSYTSGPDSFGILGGYYALYAACAQCRSEQTLSTSVMGFNTSKFINNNWYGDNSLYFGCVDRDENYGECGIKVEITCARN